MRKISLSKLKEREADLEKAHKNISEQIEALLDQRIQIKGAILENRHMQKQLEDKKEQEKGED